MTRNREGWLDAATDLLRPELEARAGVTLPPVVRVSCGFPSRRGMSLKNRALGECWAGKPNRDVFISPVLDDPLDVGHVLTHELLHAALPVGTGHGGPFKRAAKGCDLGGKPTQTVRTPELDAWLGPLLAPLGPYPHQKIDRAAGRKPQKTRLIKVHCTSLWRGCDYIIRTTRTPLDLYGAPICPNCDEQMTEA
jgi:hypothetical protein